MRGKEVRSMFFALPLLPILAVYILAAVIPAVILLRYIYRHDTVEREPASLLVVLLIMGIAAALCSGVLEGLAQSILNLLVASGSRIYTILLAFLVVAAVEEGMKFWLLKRRTWNHPAFNYRFDGIVYAVFVSLGFAAYENILYVFRYGLSVALPRALLAVPGHMSFAVCMGIYYGRAKLCAGWGDERNAHRNLWTGYLFSVLLHGIYDACAMLGTSGATMLFLAFVVVMFFNVYRKVKQESFSDAPV